MRTLKNLSLLACSAAVLNETKFASKIKSHLHDKKMFWQGSNENGTRTKKKVQRGKFSCVNDFSL